jgi:hypothetical protein
VVPGSGKAVVAVMSGSVPRIRTLREKNRT